MTELLRVGDIAVIAVGFLILIVIGFVTARKNTSTDAFFMAGRKMPGWTVGFSLMATMVSCMSFLAIPEFSYKSDWRWIGSCIAYPIAVFFMLVWFMPFFRKGHVNSAYEYLEHRFGLWARLYVAFGFVMNQLFRTAIILYVISLPIQTMSGFSVPCIILVFGIIVIIYTVAGGLEAVIWADVIQGTGLLVGGALCLPIICHYTPGGLSEIVRSAIEAGKISLGPLDANFTSLSFWCILLSTIFLYIQWGCTDQTFIQRYCAPKTDREARKALLLGLCLCVPVWIYFTFIGTALWVFYKTVPTPEIANLDASQVFPFFILTRLPVGITGLVYMSLIMAATSTIDSGINASATTIVTDFYRRLIVKNRDDKHYVLAGRISSIVFGVLMMGLAILIHYLRTKTLNEIQHVFSIVCGSGLLGLFLLGFATLRAYSKAALIATVCTVIVVAAWLFLGTDKAVEQFPQLEGSVPHILWIGVFANIFIFATGYIITLLFKRKSKKDLTNLTVWTQD